MIKRQKKKEKNGKEIKEKKSVRTSNYKLSGTQL